ncbi:unnamed protein product [Echinostoma caproni]|uniref:Glyco_hydro_38C domain-containing protein n=1 Tax=Echinostoma caproni TaxID=27848 RepID=A0A183B1I8_9TREM|nr:unnamed protein product [Echinostoma caproni]
MTFLWLSTPPIMLARYLDWYRDHGDQFNQHPVVIHWSTLEHTNIPPVRITAFPPGAIFPASRWIVMNLCKPFQLLVFYGQVYQSDTPGSNLLIGHYAVPVVPPCPSGFGRIRVGTQLDKDGKFSVFRVELLDKPSRTDLPSSVSALNAWVDTDQGRLMPLEFQLLPVPLTNKEVKTFLQISVRDSNETLVRKK